MSKGDGEYFLTMYCKLQVTRLNLQYSCMYLVVNSSNRPGAIDLVIVFGSSCVEALKKTMTALEDVSSASFSRIQVQCDKELSIR